MEMHQQLIEFSWTLLMHLATVLVLFLILKKFFFEKVRNFMLARQATVKDAFDNAEMTNRKADEKLDAYSRKLAGAEDEGREFIKTAKVRADNQARQIVEEAEAKASQLLQQALVEIEREKRKAVAEMRDQVAVLALLAAEKIIEKQISISGQDEIIDRIIEQAGTSGWQN